LVALGLLLMVWAVRVFLFKASCAVGEVKEPGFWKASLLILLACLVNLGLGYGFGWLFGLLEVLPDTPLGPMRAFGLVLSLVASVAVNALVYWPFLAASYLRTLWVAVIELLLLVLAWSLLILVFLVGLAVNQWLGVPLWLQALIAVVLVAAGVGGYVLYRVLTAPPPAPVAAPAEAQA
jgi:hypothetical protein